MSRRGDPVGLLGHGRRLRRIQRRGALAATSGGRAAAGLRVEGGERLSAYGPRAGFAAEAYLAGARDEQAMDQTRHRDPKTMRGHVRRAKLVTEIAVKLPDL